ncbi:hypothetical protein K504DRAFT_81944 [Pleomassaria siparia CBS 279.74]|uniref:Uncharacterized protein n=1 Tax=Pleomassaria siparia CBS 279.74 TaxID=1314801 RepID=A0A6G1K1R2_9PLEO|nr:hypothetical protein K504DRAFT_81944 [Pleomassaria siparia CBS 279.74]
MTHSYTQDARLLRCCYCAGRVNQQCSTLLPLPWPLLPLLCCLGAVCSSLWMCPVYLNSTKETRESTHSSPPTARGSPTIDSEALHEIILSSPTPPRHEPPTVTPRVFRTPTHDPKARRPLLSTNSPSLSPFRPARSQHAPALQRRSRTRTRTWTCTTLLTNPPRTPGRGHRSSQVPKPAATTRAMCILTPGNSHPHGRQDGELSKHTLYLSAASQVVLSHFCPCKPARAAISPRRSHKRRQHWKL